jgi:hypothetical protein
MKKERKNKQIKKERVRIMTKESTKKHKRKNELVMKNLIAKLAKLRTKSVKNISVKLALLCLVAHTAAFSMSLFRSKFGKLGSRDLLAQGQPMAPAPVSAAASSEIDSYGWTMQAEQLYDTLVAIEDKQEVDQILKKGLDGQREIDRQKIVDYLFERAVLEKIFDKAEIFFAHGANPDA